MGGVCGGAANNPEKNNISDKTTDNLKNPVSKEELETILKNSKRSALYLSATWCKKCDPELVVKLAKDKDIIKSNVQLIVGDFDNLKRNRWHTGYTPVIVLFDGHDENGDAKMTCKFSGNQMDAIQRWANSKSVEAKGFDDYDKMD